MKHLSYLNKYLYKYKHLVFLGIVFIIISNIFQIVPAVIIRYAIDIMMDKVGQYQYISDTIFSESFRNDTIIAALICVFLIIISSLLRGGFLFLVRQTIIIMSRYIEYDLKNELFKHFQTLPLFFYKSRNTGDLMARISEDVSKVRMYLGPGIMYGINLFFLFCMVIPYMFYTNVMLSVYALLPFPLLSIIIYFVSRIINKRSEIIQNKLSSLSTFVQEKFSGIRVIKSFAREDESVKAFEEESEEYKINSLSLTRVQALFFPIIVAMIGISIICTVYIGGLEIFKGKATYGTIAEFMIYMNMLTWPVIALGWITSIIQRAAASQKRINEILYVVNDLESEEKEKPPLDGSIVFDKVSLTYENTKITALEDVSFRINEGESLAIIGTTGSGKTTIASLIARAILPTRGEIFLSDYNILKLDQAHLRDKIGYVPQDVFLFSTTIKDNISFGADNKYSDESIIEATKLADFYEEIQKLPNQFDTVLGERGITLSGGQKQRISIARALIRKPKILLLDDCLSAVDTTTENTILENLKTVMKDCVTIIISHRVSSAKLADKVIVLDKGKVIEEGTHDLLLSKDGVYKNLYEKQLKKSEHSEV